MPVPKEGEKRSDFISRCIPIVINEGTTDDPKQAAAICYSIWKKKYPKSKSEILKSIKSQLEELSLELIEIKKKIK